jgi:DNA-binding FadR family transcriptional regulator
MAQDRIGKDEVTLTHELLSLMLGVRRPGVTVALKILENAGLVQTHRGIITIVDRKRLEELPTARMASQKRNMPVYSVRPLCTKVAAYPLWKRV